MGLCIGIIFLLWLCLVIPNNAPKQRVKKNINTKEAEATLAVVTVDTKNNYAKDLPPAYEEVANLSVQLEPVHKELVKSQKPPSNNPRKHQLEFELPTFESNNNNISLALSSLVFVIIFHSSNS